MNQRRDTPYWRDAAQVPVSDSLARLLDCWFTGGDLTAEIEAQDIGRYQAIVYGQYIRKFDARSEVQEEYLANELDELIYVVNLRTYNLIYVNQAFKDYFHVQPR